MEGGLSVMGDCQCSYTGISFILVTAFTVYNNKFIIVILEGCDEKKKKKNVQEVYLGYNFTLDFFSCD